MSKVSGVKVCQNCGIDFAPRTTWQITCTKSCYHTFKAKEFKFKEQKAINVPKRKRKGRDL